MDPKEVQVGPGESSKVHPGAEFIIRVCEFLFYFLYQ
jgi:hypothetical protein